MTIQKTFHPADTATRVLCTCCGEVELLVGGDGRVFDPVVGVESWPVWNVPVDAAGTPLVRCWQCLDDALQESFRNAVRFRIVEAIALPNGDLLYASLPPVAERTDAERAELERLGILDLVAGCQRGDPVAMARMGSEEFDLLPSIPPRPATPEEVAEEAKRAKTRRRSPRVKGA